MTDWDAEMSENLQAASRRVWPAIDDAQVAVAVNRTAVGAMATIRQRADGRIILRLFEVTDSGTVYLVPTWVSSPAAMAEALANRADRARLVVA